MLSFVTDTMESFDITSTDIPSVLLQTNMEVPVWVRLCAILSEMLLKMDPKKYRYKDIIDRVKKVIHKLLNCAMYKVLIS